VHENQHCSIGNIIVNPLFRGKGVGRYLIGVMENITITKYKVKETRISCFCTNLNGLILYHKLGYIPFGLEERLDKKSMPIMLIKLKKELS
jgi:ribosomal protein S18 acetylase RimI-like enzyme